MTNALVVPLLVLLGSGVLGALVYGPIRTGLPRHTAEVRQRVRRISGADSVAHRQRRIIRAIATGVPRLRRSRRPAAGCCLPRCASSCIRRTSSPSCASASGSRRS